MKFETDNPENTFERDINKFRAPVEGQYFFKGRLVHIREGETLEEAEIRLKNGKINDKKS